MPPSKHTLALQARSVATLQQLAGAALTVAYTTNAITGAHGFVVRSPDDFVVFGPVRYQLAHAYLDGYAAARLDNLPLSAITAAPDHDCAWKHAILDAAVTHWTLTAEHDRHPRLAVHALLVQAQREALDPAISAEAAALHAQLAQSRAEAAALRAQLQARTLTESGDV